MSGTLLRSVSVRFVETSCRSSTHCDGAVRSSRSGLTRAGSLRAWRWSSQRRMARPLCRLATCRSMASSRALTLGWVLYQPHEQVALVSPAYEIMAKPGLVHCSGLTFRCRSKTGVFLETFTSSSLFALVVLTAQAHETKPVIGAGNAAALHHLAAPSSSIFSARSRSQIAARDGPPVSYRSASTLRSY